jgi:hypothetical protein
MSNNRDFRIIFRPQFIRGFGIQTSTILDYDLLRDDDIFEIQVSPVISAHREDAIVYATIKCHYDPAHFCVEKYGLPVGDIQLLRGIADYIGDAVTIEDDTLPLAYSPDFMQRKGIIDMLSPRFIADNIFEMSSHDWIALHANPKIASISIDGQTNPAAAKTA